MIEERRCADLDRPESFFGFTMADILVLTFVLMGVHQALDSLGLNILMALVVDAVVGYLVLQLMRFVSETVPAGLIADGVFWVFEPLQYHIYNDPQTLPPLIPVEPSRKPTHNDLHGLPSPN